MATKPIVVKPWIPGPQYRTETEDGDVPIALQVPTLPTPKPTTKEEAQAMKLARARALKLATTPPPIVSEPLPTIPIGGHEPPKLKELPAISQVKPLPPTPKGTSISTAITPQFQETSEGMVITNLAQIKAQNRQRNDAVDALAKYKIGDSYDIQGIISANDSKLDSAVSTLFPDVNISDVRKQTKAVDTLAPYLEGDDYDIYAIVASSNASVLSAAKLLFPNLTQSKIKDIREKGEWFSKKPIDIYAFNELLKDHKYNDLIEEYNPIKPRDAKWYAAEIQKLKKKHGFDIYEKLTPEQAEVIDWEMRNYYIKSQGVSPDLPDVKYDSPAAQKQGIYKDPKQSVNPFIQASAYISEFAMNSANTLKGYIDNVPGPAPMVQIYKFAGNTAIGALVELPLMMVNIPIMAMAFGGEFSRGALASGEYSYKKMVVPAYAAAGAYAITVGAGMAQWFGDIPKRMLEDPASTTGNLVGLFLVSPGGLLKLGKAVRLNVLTPKYFDLLRVPNRLGSFRLSGTAEKLPAGGWGHTPNMMKAVNEAMVKLAKLSEEAIIAKKPLPKSVRVQVEPGLYITLETPPLWKYLGPYMTHGGEAASFLMNEAYPNFLVGGKLRPGEPIYLSPVFARRFADQAGIGVIHKNPSYGMVFGNGGKLNYLDFTQKVIRDATEATGRAIEAEGIIPAGKVLYRLTPESYLKGGALVKYATLRTRLLKGKAGELIRIENGRTYPIHMYSVEPGLLPMRKIGLAELSAMHLEAAKLTLRDLVKDPRGKAQKKGLTIDFESLGEYAQKADTASTAHISHGVFHGDVIGLDGKFTKLRDGYWSPDPATGGYVRTTTKGSIVDTEGFIYGVRDRADPTGFFEEVAGAVHPLDQIQPGGGPGITGITRERAFWVQAWNEIGISVKNVQVVSPYLGKSSRHSIKGGYQTVSLIDHSAKIDVFKNQPKGMKVPEVVEVIRTNGVKTEIWSYKTKKWQSYTKRKIEVSPHFYDVLNGHFKSGIFQTYLKNATGKTPKVNYNIKNFKIHGKTPSELLKKTNRDTKYNPYNKIHCSLCVREPRKAAKVEKKYRENLDRYIDEEIKALLKEDPRYETFYKKNPKKFEERYQAYLHEYMKEAWKRPDYEAAYRRRGGSGKAEWERYVGIYTSNIPPNSYYNTYGPYTYQFSTRGYPSLTTVPRVPSPRTPTVPVTSYPRVPKTPDISYPRVPVVPSVSYPKAPKVPDTSYPRVPSVPPPTQPRVPPTPKIPTTPKIPIVPKTTIPPRVLIPSLKSDKAKRRFPMDSFGWKQGFGWWISTPPYSGTIGKDMFFTRIKPAGVPIGRTPAETITKLGINVPKGQLLDLGIMDINIKKKGSKIKYKRDVKQKTNLGRPVGMPPGIVGARGR